MGRVHLFCALCFCAARVVFLLFRGGVVFAPRVCRRGFVFRHQHATDLHASFFHQNINKSSSSIGVQHQQQFQLYNAFWLSACGLRSPLRSPYRSSVRCRCHVRTAKASRSGGVTMVAMTLSVGKATRPQYKQAAANSLQERGRRRLRHRQASRQTPPRARPAFSH